MSDAPRLYVRVADALTSALVVALVGGATLGLTRWLDARDFRRDVQASIAGRADGLAAVLSADPARLEQAVAATPGASVHVVRAGTTDAYGIAVGATVVAARIVVPEARPEDARAFERHLLDRSAELDDYVTRRQRIPDDRRFAVAELAGGDALFAAFAPIVRDGYAGMVRVSERVHTPPPSVPTAHLAISALTAAALAWLASYLRLGRREALVRRLLHAAIPIAPTALVFVSLDAPFPLVAGAVAGLVGLGTGPGMARVFRGVREQPSIYGYVAPAMIAMAVLVFVPFVMGVALSFFSGDDFSGFDNFREILAPSATQHPTFYWTTGFTVLWTVSNVVLHVGIGVALALVLNRPKLRLKGVYRLLLVVPWAVPNYITALIWRSMFNPQFGAVNGLLDVFGIEPVSWLGPGSSFASNYLACLTTNTWLGFPFMMVVTLGALQSIPKDLYEAADIDGAGRIQKFFRVTLPLLKPALVPAIILGVIWTFNMFNVIYLVSGGAPENETNILVTEAYYAFKVLNRFGLAAAYAILIFLMLLAYGWLQNRVTRATEGAFE